MQTPVLEADPVLYGSPKFLKGHLIDTQKLTTPDFELIFCHISLLSLGDNYSVQLKQNERTITSTFRLRVAGESSHRTRKFHCVSTHHPVTYRNTLLHFEFLTTLLDLASHSTVKSKMRRKFSFFLRLI
ncbi:hypothetical protein IEQ34_019609 [Dendrobium chrysotoxum]|uniref:Uncharacterized protein n=1 Tax=Dendrobium chrysotoxum TaxID=161865 RepID=A0AAV7FRR6_DENCH|nr:hypothetical protein IEQ34_019609 [Dendrobium chrysotoxum]